MSRAPPRVLSPAVRWESFGTSRPVDGPQGLQATPAGGSSGGTWMLSPVTVDLLVCVVDHVIAFSRRSSPHGEAEAERLEVWTLRDGKRGALSRLRDLTRGWRC